MTFHRRNSQTETNHIGPCCDVQRAHQHHNSRQQQQQQPGQASQQPKEACVVDGGNNVIVGGEYHPEIVQLWKLKDITAPTQYDCLFSSGRVGGWTKLDRHDHNGNKRFHAVVDAMAAKLVERQQGVLVDNSDEFHLVARETVKRWRRHQAGGQHPGRFLVYSRTHESWLDVGNSKALERTEAMLHKSYQRQLKNEARRRQLAKFFQQQQQNAHHLQTLPEHEPMSAMNKNPYLAVGNDSHRSGSSWTEDRGSSSSLSSTSMNSELFRSSSLSSCRSSLSSLSFGEEDVLLASGHQFHRGSSSFVRARTLSQDTISTAESSLGSCGSCHSNNSSHHNEDDNDEFGFDDDDKEEYDDKDDHKSILPTLASPTLLKHCEATMTDRLLCGCSSVVTVELPNHDGDGDETIVLTLDLLTTGVLDHTAGVELASLQGVDARHAPVHMDATSVVNYQDCSAVATLQVPEAFQPAVNLQDYRGCPSTLQACLPKSVLAKNQNKKKRKKRVERRKRRFYGYSSVSSSSAVRNTGADDAPVLLEYWYCGRGPSLGNNSNVLCAQFSWVLDPVSSLPVMRGRVWVAKTTVCS